MMRIPGARHRAADVMSRHHTGSYCPPILEVPDDVCFVNDISDLPPTPHPTLVPDRLLSCWNPDCWWQPFSRLRMPHPRIKFRSLERSSGSGWGSSLIIYGQWYGHEQASVQKYRIWHAQSSSWTSHPTQRLPPVVIYKTRVVIPPPSIMRSSSLSMLHTRE